MYDPPPDNVEVTRFYFYYYREAGFFKNIFGNKQSIMGLHLTIMLR